VACRWDGSTQEDENLPNNAKFHGAPAIQVQKTLLEPRCLASHKEDWIDEDHAGYQACALGVYEHHAAASRYGQPLTIPANCDTWCA
jgi:hypothetical protein